MSQNIAIKIEKVSIEKLKTSLFISGKYKNQKVNKSLDDLLGTTLKNAFSTDSFKGDFGKKIDLFSNGKINKFSFYGLGEKNKLDSNKLRSLAANIVRNIELNKISSVTIDSDSFGLSKSLNAQAFTEGLLLGQYKFLDYKTKKTDFSLSEVIFTGDVDLKSLSKGQIIGG